VLERLILKHDAKPMCHTRRIKMGQIPYDYRRKGQLQISVPWLRLKGFWIN